MLPWCSLYKFGIIFILFGGVALLQTMIGTWYVLCFLCGVFLYLVLSSSCLEKRPCYRLRLEHGMYCASSVESFCIWYYLHRVWRSGPVTDYNWNTVCTVLPQCSLSVFGIIFFVFGGAALLHTMIGTRYELCFLCVVFLYLVLSLSCLEERPCYIL